MSERSGRKRLTQRQLDEIKLTHREDQEFKQSALRTKLLSPLDIERRNQWQVRARRENYGRRDAD